MSDWVTSFCLVDSSIKFTTTGEYRHDQPTFIASPLFYIIPLVYCDFLYHSPSMVEAGYNCRSSQAIRQELIIFDFDEDSGVGRELGLFFTG